MCKTILMFLALILLLFFTNPALGATRIYFKRCSQDGFTCFNNLNKIIELTYECPKGVNDIIFFINEFNKVYPNVEKLMINNCNTVTLSTKCTTKSINYLKVSNIKNLSFQKSQHDSMLPPTVIFENILHVATIPARTFNQIQKDFLPKSCTVPSMDFQNLYFRNVTIDLIESNAFFGKKSFMNFSFVNVQVKRIQTSAIQLDFDVKGVFEIKFSNLEVIEYLGIQLYTMRSILSENNFTEISSGGINGSMEDFYFTNNFVETLHPYGFSILGTNIFILNNTFLHLKHAALEMISPGLIHTSNRSIGKLKFIYDFSKNSLSFLDAGSLNPDYVSYENVQTEMTVSRNKFLCTCESLGWLFSSLGHGPNSAQLETFYEMVLDKSYGNICDKSFAEPCELPLKRVGDLIKCGQCLNNLTIEELCYKITAVSDAVTEKYLTTDYKELGPEELNYLDTEEKESGSVFINCNNVLLIGLFALGCLYK